jgi:GNAT superfamily N-acetyltransferase
MTIRVAQPHDLLALQDIENDADRLFIERFRPDEWWPAPAGHDRGAVPGFLLVAVDESEVVLGFVHVVEDDGHAHLEQLSVAPAHARQGHGGALVRAAKKVAAARGYQELTLRTYEGVPWNAPFYATMGFRPSEPTSAFHRRLLDVEAGLGLDRYGHRIQMTAPLSK